MYKKDKAIVLQHRSYTLELLSEQQGKVTLFWYQNKKSLIISAGSLISYTLSCTRKNSIEDVCLESAPFLLAQNNIYFLHGIIELCSFFIQTGSIETPLYRIITFILAHFTNYLSLKEQKIIFCILFSHLGISPDTKEVGPYLSFFLQVPIDKFYDLDLQLVPEKMLDEWLSWSLAMHPFRKSFKALPYISKK